MSCFYYCNCTAYRSCCIFLGTITNILYYTGRDKDVTTNRRAFHLYPRSESNLIDSDDLGFYATIICELQAKPTIKSTRLAIQEFADTRQTVVSPISTSLRTSMRPVLQCQSNEMNRSDLIATQRRIRKKDPPEERRVYVS